MTTVQSLRGALIGVLAAMETSIEVGHTDHLDIDGDYWYDAINIAETVLKNTEST